MTAVASQALAPLDLAAWSGLPVACVPVGSAFQQITEGRRLLIARGGLFLEAASASLYVRVPLSECFTPWGEIAPAVELRAGSIPPSIAQDLAKRALAAHPKEMAALVVADGSAEEGYRLLVPTASATGGSVTYQDVGYDEGSLVIDAHSHGAHGAFFSGTDDASDMSRLGPHISIVFGHCADRESMQMTARLCIGHYLLPFPNHLLTEFFA